MRCQMVKFLKLGGVNDRILITESNGNLKTTIIIIYGLEGKARGNFELLSETGNSVPKCNFILLFGNLDTYLGFSFLLRSEVIQRITVTHVAV